MRNPDVNPSVSRPPGTDRRAVRRRPGPKTNPNRPTPQTR
jgi:hypothetical protein